MSMNQLYSWLLGFGLALAAGPSLGASAPPLLVGRLTWVTDSDQDGIDDTQDLCPGTPAGTTVNAYGCPMNVAQCDYTTSTVTLIAQGGSIGAGISTRYVLTSITGTILQISPTASFTGLTGTATYMALAVTYDGIANNLTVGNTLSAVSASCLDWSDALVFKACVIPPATCDYQVGETIVLRATGGSAGAGILTRYVLTDATGKLVSLSTTPSFSSAALAAGTYRAYALTYTDDTSLANLVVNGTNTLSQVTASCLASSEAYPVTLCGDCHTSCVPILIVRTRR